jgi:serine/threonine-protein kinase
VVHRDLKPANIFLLQVPGEPEFVKVLDFGISKVKVANGRRLTGVQSVVGTPAYMSPEQATGRSEETDHRADQWALACIAWEILCGHPPFMADDTTALFFQILRIEPPSLTKQVPDLQPAAEAVLRRALSKHHTDRYPSIRDFARAFELAALGHFTESTPAPLILPRPADSGGFRAAGKTPPAPILVADDEPTTVRDSAGRLAILPQLTARVPRFKQTVRRLGPLTVAALVALIALGSLLLRSRGPAANDAHDPPALPRPRVVSLPSSAATTSSPDPTSARTESTSEMPPRPAGDRPPRAKSDRKPTSRIAGKARPSPANARNKHRLFEEL